METVVMDTQKKKASGGGDRIAKQDESTHLSFFGQMPGGITLPCPLNV